MLFFPGLHHPADARNFPRAFVSVNALRRLGPAGEITKQRRSDFPVNDWILDSGAFSEISKHGRYRASAGEYAWQIRRWSSCGNLLAACTQDWMCEPKILERTGLDVVEHQTRTVERYLAIRRALEVLGCTTYLLPVLQGFEPAEYVACLDAYEAAGAPIAAGAWVGVGSVCKRNTRPEEVEAVLEAILEARPDLELHGFGIKLTALRSPVVRRSLKSADSMAWSFSAFKQGRDPNDWREAAAFADKVEDQLGPNRP